MLSLDKNNNIVFVRARSMAPVLARSFPSSDTRGDAVARLKEGGGWSTAENLSVRQYLCPSGISRGKGEEITTGIHIIDR